MIVLGLDSSAKTAGVAVVRREAQQSLLVYESWLSAGLTHSETLLELVDGALRACRLQPGQVDVYAVTAGPGSFTGLRIGMALVKGLAAANNTPCVPVSTLEALAAGCDAPGVIVPAMDARRGEVYTAAFLRDAAGLHRLRPDTAAPAAKAAEAALAAARDNAAGLTLLGDGAALCRAALPQALTLPVWCMDEDHRCRAAAAAAHIGAQQAQAGLVVEAGQLRPDYHRLCQAERERAERLAAQQAGQ